LCFYTSLPFSNEFISFNNKNNKNQNPKNNTKLYIQLDKQLFNSIPDDNFIIRAVNTIKEATKIGEADFEPLG